jgi:hypothetical protein
MAPDLPPPLPPGERTVGQLVAESIRTYGDNFWRAVPLALPFAALNQFDLGRDTSTQFLLFIAFTPLLALAFAAACALVGRVRPTGRRLVVATATGVIVLLPTALLVAANFALLVVAYLAFVGLVVPVAVLEGKGPVAAFRRAIVLGRADYVHALGSLATLVIVFFLSRLVLIALLHDQADNTVRAAIFLADLVLAPLMLLGAAMLYFDQAARVGLDRAARRRGGDREADPSSSANARAER